MDYRLYVKDGYSECLTSAGLNFSFRSIAMLFFCFYNIETKSDFVIDLGFFLQKFGFLI